MAVVYRHIRLDKNEPFYIGIGKSESRAYSKNNRNRYWNFVTNKYDYKVEIVCDNVDYKTAKQIEKYLIAYYGRKDLGLGTLVNMTDGGDGSLNHNPSKETRLKMRASRLGKKMSKESKLKTSEARKGKGNGMYGKNAHNAINIYCGYLDKEFDNITSCAKELGRSQSYISNMLVGKTENIYKLSKI